MYGCKWKQDPIQTRIFPFILDKVSKYFSFQDCRFNLKKSKRCTARIQLYKILKINSLATISPSPRYQHRIMTLFSSNTP